MPVYVHVGPSPASSPWLGAVAIERLSAWLAATTRLTGVSAQAGRVTHQGPDCPRRARGVAWIQVIPPPTHPSWVDLIKGQTQHRFSLPSAGMLVFNLQRDYRRDPSRLADHVELARRFFEKNEKRLQADIARLFGPEDEE
jgi:hypothetical protein